jgi:hypothetical protein
MCLPLVVLREKPLLIPAPALIVMSSYLCALLLLPAARTSDHRDVNDAATVNTARRASISSLLPPRTDLEPPICARLALQQRV